MSDDFLVVVFLAAFHRRAARAEEVPVVETAPGDAELVDAFAAVALPEPGQGFGGRGGEETVGSGGGFEGEGCLSKGLGWRGRGCYGKAGGEGRWWDGEVGGFEGRWGDGELARHCRGMTSCGIDEVDEDRLRIDALAAGETLLNVK